MNNLTKKVLMILAIVSIMGVIASVPGFAETQDELKQIFVTREEVINWINGNEGQTGIKDALSNLEKNMQIEVQSRVKVEMKKRGIKDNVATLSTISS